MKDGLRGAGDSSALPEPASQRTVRRQNLALLLRHVADLGPRTRAAIAIETGFNKSTVSSLVAELLDSGLLAERRSDPDGAVGRPSMLVELSGERLVALGMEIRVDALAVEATDLTGAVRHHWTEGADNRTMTPESVLARLGVLADAAMDAVRGQRLRPIGVAVAIPGLVESASGTLLTAPNLGWSDVRVGDFLSERLPGRPAVACDNEANLAALAELWQGAATGLSDFIYVSGGIGVGAGVVIDGQVQRGSRGFGGELGHATVDRAGPECVCGNRGCVEAFVGLEALLRAAALPVGEIGTTGHSRSLQELVERAGSGDPRVRQVLADAGEQLGVALASVSNVLNPQAVVLGGFFAPLSPWLRPVVEHELRARVLSSQWGSPPVLASAFAAGGAGVRGAAMLSLQRALADPASLIAA